MTCDRCGEQIPAGDEMDYHGRILCESCYMGVLSPAVACDPWAVQSAQTLSRMGSKYSGLNAVQEKILQLLGETGGIEPAEVAERLGLSIPELSREIATLRHMEKIRGRMHDGRRIICLW